jgi:hypothetical protein
MLGPLTDKKHIDKFFDNVSEKFPGELDKTAKELFGKKSARD